MRRTKPGFVWFCRNLSVDRRPASGGWGLASGGAFARLSEVLGTEEESVWNVDVSLYIILHHQQDENQPRVNACLSGLAAAICYLESDSEKPEML